MKSTSNQFVNHTAPYEAPETLSKAEFARRTVKDSIDKLTQQLESGNSAHLTAYLSAMSRFRAYSINNLFLILAQRPDATRVAGFHTWRAMDRMVKRGEKGIAIFAPMKIKSKKADDNQDEDESGSSPMLRFRVVHVFDVSQTEGKPIPEFAEVTGNPGEMLQRLEDAVRADGIVLANANDLGGALGVSKGGRIELIADLPPPKRFSVLAHEYAHEKLHKVNSSERPDVSTRELEAEAVAFVVNSAIGLETGTASADYIRLYDGDKENLTASLDRIQQTACSIINAISGDQSRRDSTKRSATRQSSMNTRQR
jgi:hypothetical protein